MFLTIASNYVKVDRDCDSDRMLSRSRQHTCTMRALSSTILILDHNRERTSNIRALIS